MEDLLAGMAQNGFSIAVAAYFLRGDWGPIHITSGYRCIRHNAEVGGVPKSRHLIGAAADIAVPQSKQSLFVNLAKKHGFDQVIPYRHRGFVHLGIYSRTQAPQKPH